MAGYIGVQSGAIATVAEQKHTFIATSGQTVFGLPSGYTPKNVHVYQNGVRLVEGTDYTAINGSDVSLTVGALAGDQVVIIAPASYQNADSYTKAETTASVSTQSLTVDRQSTDGIIAEFRKDGTTVGSIGVKTGSSPYITIGNVDTGLLFNGNDNTIEPWNVSTNSGSDGAINLGAGSARFKDLYLSGGVFLGGTTSANHLEDYEEGTFTPTFTSRNGDAVTAVSFNEASYTKVGNIVNFRIYCAINVTSVGTGSAIMGGLPFINQGDWTPVCLSHNTFAGYTADVEANGFELRFRPEFSTAESLISGTGQKYAMISGTYKTNA